MRVLTLVLWIALLATLGAGCAVPDYVGSRDCDQLVDELDVPWFAEKCAACQGATCEGEGYCRLNFPCEAGKIVVQGCAEDADCSELKALCAKATAQPHNVCTLSDAF
jgi:hypothetical protein